MLNLISLPNVSALFPTATLLDALSNTLESVLTPIPIFELPPALKLPAALPK